MSRFSMVMGVGALVGVGVVLFYQALTSFTHGTLTAVVMGSIASRTGSAIRR